MKSDNKGLWRDCLKLIRSQLAEDVFDVWFKDTELINFENGKVTIGVPSEYYVMQYENRLKNVFRAALKEVFGSNIKIEYTYYVVSSDPTSAVTIEKSTSDGENNQKKPEGKQTSRTSRKGGVIYEDFDSQLNPAYTFENYCHGRSNQLPFTIAESIGNNPGNTNFNPFFLFGNTGVGKTHLIQGIGQRIKQQNPSAKVLYVSARTFTKQYGQAAGAPNNGRIDDFIAFYQNLDALLIDDIQEFAGMAKTQNAFFTIFNHLHLKGTLLIMTSDRPPVDLTGIMDRLINRFKWGVTEQLLPPDFELRKMILRNKSQKNGLNLPEDVINVIANHVTDSVRELESIVLSLIARAALVNQPITPQLTEAVMQSIVKINTKRINFDMIVENVAAKFDLDPDVIFSRSRVRDIADARQVIMYLAYKLTDLSSKVIGYKLSRSHVTVLHGIKTIENRITLEQPFAHMIEEIENTLRNT